MSDSPAVSTTDSTSEKSQKINTLQLFHDLTSEAYYGLNMRIVLMEQPSEFIAQLDQFVRDCKIGRS